MRWPAGVTMRLVAEAIIRVGVLDGWEGNLPAGVTAT